MAVGQGFHQGWLRRGVLTLAVGASLVSAGCGGGSSAHTVLYQVSGTATSIHVGYTTDSQATQAFADVPPGWSKQVSLSGSPLVLSLDASANTPAGTVTCTLIVDGTTVATGNTAGGGQPADCGKTYS